SPQDIRGGAERAVDEAWEPGRPAYLEFTLAIHISARDHVVIVRRLPFPVFPGVLPGQRPGQVRQDRHVLSVIVIFALALRLALPRALCSPHRVCACACAWPLRSRSVTSGVTTGPGTNKAPGGLPGPYKGEFTRVGPWATARRSRPAPGILRRNDRRNIRRAPREL